MLSALHSISHIADAQKIFIQYAILFPTSDAKNNINNHHYKLVFPEEFSFKDVKSLNKKYQVRDHTLLNIYRVG